MEVQICKIFMWTITKSLLLSSGLRGLLIACTVALQSKLQHMYWTTFFCLEIVELGASVELFMLMLIPWATKHHPHTCTHCISIKISHNSAPQHAWSSNISMPDLPFVLFPGAAQLQHICCILALPQVPWSFWEGLHGKLPTTQVP